DGFHVFLLVVVNRGETVDGEASKARQLRQIGRSAAWTVLLGRERQCRLLHALRFQQRYVHFREEALPRGEDLHAWLFHKIARKAFRIRNPMPRFDANEVRAGLGPNAEIRGIGKVDPQPRSCAAAIADGPAFELIEDQATLW